MRTPPTILRERLQFLAKVVEREFVHLQTTDRRLFATPLTQQQLAMLEQNPDLAERIDAFVSRFGRLQDTLGDKLLPQLFRLVGERPTTFVDNLDRAERLGWIVSSDQWLDARKLRNHMVHEYIDDLAILLDALQQGHELVGPLAAAAQAMLAELRARLAGATTP